ncbi:MAG: OmpA family protein [Thermodesulfobacteriota bacterium]
MARKEEIRCEEGLPAWLATFADMMSLLLCFFVLLLSFANQDLENFKMLLGSIKDAFGVQREKKIDEAAFSSKQYDRPGMDMSRQARVDLKLTMQLRDLMGQDTEMRKATGVQAEEDGVLVRVDTGYLFEPGSLKFTPDAAAVLDRIVATLKDYTFHCVIRGHSDDNPEHGSPYPSNWELSAARAAHVLRYLADNGGISPLRLKAVGYADSRPLVPNNTEVNRIRNRRVEFFFHRPNTLSW